MSIIYMLVSIVAYLFVIFLAVGFGTIFAGFKSMTKDKQAKVMRNFAISFCLISGAIFFFAFMSGYDYHG